MRELILKRCMKCGALVEVLKDCTCENCGIKCCGEQMEILKANTSDGAKEKHVPTYEVKGDNIVVTVNHVMEDEHYIEWIALVTDKKVGKKYLNPGQKAEVEFPYEKGSKIYAYCNKHLLWSCDVE